MSPKSSSASSTATAKPLRNCSRWSMIGQPAAHLLLETNDGHGHPIIDCVQPLHQAAVRGSIRALNEAQDIRVEDNHARLASRFGRCPWRYARPSFTICSKTGSAANRPAWVRYHLRLGERLVPPKRRTVCSKAFTCLSIWISVIRRTCASRWQSNSGASNQEASRAQSRHGVAPSPHTDPIIERGALNVLRPLPSLLALWVAFPLLAYTAFAQTWQTVDDFQYVSGQDAQNYGLAVAPHGTLFASGMAGASTGLYRGLLMASTDAGNTWSAPLDDYLYAPGYQVWYDGGIGTDSAGNLYVAGEAYGQTDPANHWVIRRSSDIGATWSLVDDFAPGSPQTQPFGLATDAAGNVYVAGVANHVGVNDLVWTVRKGMGGTSLTTVDTYQLSQNLNSRAFGVGADASGNIYAVGQGFVKSGKNDYGHWIAVGRRWVRG